MSNMYRKHFGLTLISGTFSGIHSFVGSFHMLYKSQLDHWLSYTNLWRLACGARPQFSFPCVSGSVLVLSTANEHFFFKLRGIYV